MQGGRSDRGSHARTLAVPEPAATHMPVVLAEGSQVKVLAAAVCAACIASQEGTPTYT